MIKLKTILNSKKVFLIIIFISTIRLINYINTSQKSIYSLSDNLFICIVKDITNNKTILDCNEIIEGTQIDAKIGDIVKINGKLEEFESNKNINLFNYKIYQNNREVFYKLKINKYEVIGKSKKISLNIKRIILDKIKKLKSYNYLKSFILGDKNYIGRKQINTYKMIGIIHLFAISGMHLSFLIELIDKIYIKNSNKKTIFTAVFVFIYYKIIESISLLRCLIFIFIRRINKILSLNMSKEKEIIISLLIILMIKPNAIDDTGFYYSFIISSGIILINKKLKRVNSKIKKTIIITIFAFLLSLPINTYQNFEINFMTIIYNLIFIPFISVIIFPLSLLTLMLPFLDNILFTFINILEFTANLLKGFSIILIVRKPSIALIVIYYFILYLSFHNYKYLYIFILIFLFHYNYSFFIKEKFVLFLDVGQGDSILIHRNNINILIDTGGQKNNYSISQYITIPLLKSFGIKKINYLILTHGDYDHMGEAINLINNFKIEKVIFNCGSYNNLEKELIKVLDKKHIKHYSCIKELNIDKNKLYFLQTKEYDNENDNSNVIYTELNGYKFMFMGDASSTTEKEIIDKYNLPDIDVLKVGHHGSKTSSSQEFINKIQPKYSIISVGKNNRYGHPNKKALDNLENSKIYRTDEDGSIMFKIKNNKIKIDTCSP